MSHVQLYFYLPVVYYTRRHIGQRDREKDRQIDRLRDRHRQTERQRHTQREADRDRDRDRETETEIKTQRARDRQKDRQTGRQAETQRRTDRQRQCVGGGGWGGGRMCEQLHTHIIIFDVRSLADFKRQQTNPSMLKESKINPPSQYNY